MSHGSHDTADATAAELCESIGLKAGDVVDIRKLRALCETHGIDAYLYWEEDLAREGDLERDIRDYAGIPEENRPFIHIEGFIRFFTETYAMFPKSTDELFEAIPLRITILSCGRRTSAGRKAYVIGLMPFLDEIDV
ncbi:MAG: hypothetical protein APR53_03660 [Methanoculleus sp. SDB]|nr:MAG: hypothetical protein APR53_03660 [Methanoculleus sp. SDB]